MEPEELADILRVQKAIANEAEAHRGEKATNKPERHELLLKQDMVSIMLGMQISHDKKAKTYITEAAYPPSDVSLAQLKPLLLKDLRLDTHHRGRVIFVRFITAAIRTVGITNVIEDTSGDVDQMVLYNTSLDSDPRDHARNGGVYAIKEPYYTFIVEGGYGIRIDHPSDLMYLTEDHNYMPRAFTPRLIERLSAEAHKEQGNVHYKAKRYQMAAESYGRGIQACTADEHDLQADQHRNRAQVNLLLGKYESAVWDANRSCECLTPGPKADALNCKALHRAGRALYALSRFEEAQAKYEMALDCAPDDAGTLKAMDEVKQRIIEATTGVYDMEAIIKLCKTHPQRLNIASYVKDVAVKLAGNRGRGLFAKKEFKAGDTVISEKALAMCMPEDGAKEQHYLLDVNSERGLSNSYAAVLYSLVEKLRNNPQLARQFLDLYNQDYKPSFHACEVDDCTVIDSFEVLAILQANCFGAAMLENGQIHESVGVWMTASYMNHSCDANTDRMFVGDMMTMKATRDIAKGEELFASYLGTDVSSHVNIQQRLHALWGFKCACAICKADAKLTPVQQDDRSTLLQDITTLIGVIVELPEIIGFSQRLLEQVEALYGKLLETYSPALYDRLPRLDLVAPSHWIMSSYTSKRNIARAKPLALEVLRNCGFFITVEDGQFSVERKHCVVALPYCTVDALLHLSAIHRIGGNNAVGAQFSALAREVWLFTQPSMDSFIERNRVQWQVAGGR